MKITKRNLIKLIKEQIDYSGADPRWNPDVANAMGKEAEKFVASKNLNFTTGLFKLVNDPKMWGSEPAVHEVPKEIHRKFGKYFQNGLVSKEVRKISGNNNIEKVIDRDYQLVDTHETPKTEYHADHKYKLYKTKNNKYFVFVYSDKPERAGDSPHLYAGDGGGSNWSGFWRLPDL